MSYDEHITQLEEELARKDSRIVELKNAGYGKDDKIRSLGYDILNLEDKLSRLERELDSARSNAEYEKNQAYQEGYQHGQNNAVRYSY